MGQISPILRVGGVWIGAERGVVGGKVLGEA